MFEGTRVPIQTLIDYLEGGESIDDFLDGFPTVTKKQVIVLAARTNRLEDLSALVPKILEALPSAEPGGPLILES